MSVEYEWGKGWMGGYISDLFMCLNFYTAFHSQWENNVLKT
jgi:hypothetical protein